MNEKRINVSRGDVVCIRDGSGAVVAVERGTAWLTQCADHRDMVLEAGGTFRLDRAGVAVVSAVDADLVVTAAAGASLPAISTSSRAARGVARARRRWTAAQPVRV